MGRQLVREAGETCGETCPPRRVRSGQSRWLADHSFEYEMPLVTKPHKTARENCNEQIQKSRAKDLRRWTSYMTLKDAGRQ